MNPLELCSYYFPGQIAAQGVSIRMLQCLVGHRTPLGALLYAFCKLKIWPLQVFLKNLKSEMFIEDYVGEADFDLHNVSDFGRNN